MKVFGQLTSHRNPPALQFVPEKTGFHEFYADLITGAYSVKFID